LAAATTEQNSCVSQVMLRFNLIVPNSTIKAATTIPSLRFPVHTTHTKQVRSTNAIKKGIINAIFFFGATAPIWALVYLHETPRFTSVF
jgi:hypothetical protein